MSDHDETVVEARLRAAGAALRGEAPGTDDVDRSFDRLVERSGRRTWWLAPAIIGAAAAAAIGIVAITGADQTVRQVPVDTGVVPTVPATVPAPRTVPNTTPATAPSTATAAPATPAASGPTSPATATATAPVAPPVTAAPTTPATAAPTSVTPSTTPGVDLGFGVELRTSDENFDGDGGACLTLSSATDSVRGCVDGPTRRSAYLNPLSFRLDGQRYTLHQTGWQEPGGPELRSYQTSEAGVSECELTTGLTGVLLDGATCDYDFGGIVGSLPTSPDGDATWTVFPAVERVGAASAAEGQEVDLVVASEAAGTRVFRTRAGDGVPSCLVIDGPDAISREACGLEGAGTLVAGSLERPIVVTYDVPAGTVDVTEVDPGVAPLANGCSTPIGTLVARLPIPIAITDLRCVDGAVVAGYASTYVRPEPVEAGTILLFAAGEEQTPLVGGDGSPLRCDAVEDGCPSLGSGSELAEALLPVPPVEVLTADFGTDLLEPRNNTERYAEIGPVADEEALYAAVDQAWRAIGDTDSDSTPTYAGRSPLIVAFSGIPDDALGSSVLAVWYTSGDDGLRIDTVIDVAGCARGTTTLDGEPVCV